MPRSGTAGSYNKSVFRFFSETFLLFSIVGIPIYILTNNVGEFPFLHIRGFIFKQTWSFKTFSFDLKIHFQAGLLNKPPAILKNNCDILSRILV